MKLLIEKYQKRDGKGCLNIIEKVVVDGFIEEGIDIDKENEHLSQELEIQRNRIKENGDKYLVAKHNNKVIGLIAYNTPCEVVNMALDKLEIHPKSIEEVISLYVSPVHQRNGIGTQLFAKIIEELKKINIEYFAISTGYKKGRSFWTKNLGEVSIVFPTYYSGWPCSVWIRKVSDII